MTKLITRCDCCKQECNTHFRITYKKSGLWNLTAPKEMDLCGECAKLIGTIIKTTPSEDTLDFDKTVTTLKALKSIKKT